MKKAGVALLLLLALVHIAFAAETQIFSGKIITDSDITADGKIFRFSYDDVSKKAFAQNPSINLIIGLGDCKQNDFFKICINSANYSHRNVTTYKNFYEMNVVISKYDYGIVFNSTSPSELLQGQQGDFSFSIRNPTTVDMENLQLSINLSSFTVTGVTVCDFDGTLVSWKGNFPPGYYKSCSMKLSGYGSGKFPIKAEVDYILNAQKVSQDTELASIEVLPNQLDVEYSFDPDAELTKPFHFNLTATNINSLKQMDVTAIISFPLGLDFVKGEPFYYDKSTGRLKESYRLESGKSKNYSFHIKSAKELKTPFSIEFLYSIDEIPDSYSNVTFINVTEPTPIIEIIPQSKNATLGQKFVVVVKVTNPSESFSFERLTGTLSSQSNSDIVEKVQKINLNETYTLISHTIVIPRNAPSNYSLEFVLEYWLNEFRKTKSVSLAIEISNSSSSSANAASPSSSPPSSSSGSQSLGGSPGTLRSGLDSSVSTAESFALIFSSFSNMNSFQKIMLVFGIMLVISIFSIFVVLKKLKAKEGEKLKEATSEISKEKI